MNRLRCACALAVGLWFLGAAARGESSYAGPDKVRSASGQFIVTFTPDTSWFYHPPDVTTNTGFLRLEPSLLAISAEHFKAAVWQEIGLRTDTPWSGKIFIALHSARSTNETVRIATDPFIRYWNYRLELPDLISRNRYARALSAVLLMEFANRNVSVSRQPAMIPPWLADGLARQILAADDNQVILSVPARQVNGLPLTRINEDQRGIDPLAGCRRVLQNHPALTFNQLSWPDDAQEDGADGGVYLASAQLFVSDLFQLPDGRAKVRNLLVRLASCENWQTAFFDAFQKDFRSPLDVEKWWSLRVVAFAARDPGPLWTVAVSRRKLDAILSVPVDVRYASNALPSHAQISLQATLRNFVPPHQTEILEAKLRDLNLVQLRLAAPLAPIGDGYRNALADFLAYEKKHGSARYRRSAKEQLIHQLDNLDQRRQELETRLERQALPVPAPK